MSETPVTVLGATPASALYNVIADELLKLNEGDTCTWEHLEQVTGQPRVSLYSVTASAKRKLMSERGLHFTTTKGIGILRLSPSEVVTETMPKHVRKIAGHGRKIIKTSEKLDYDRLSKQEQQLAAAQSTVGTLAANLGRKQTVKRLAEGGFSKALSPKDASHFLLGSGVLKGSEE